MKLFKTKPKKIKDKKKHSKCLICNVICDESFKRLFSLLNSAEIHSAQEWMEAETNWA